MAAQTELYRFTEQDSVTVWTYTSGNQPINYNAGAGVESYQPLQIQRSEVESKSELARANLDVQVPLDNDAALRWLADNGKLLVNLTIFEVTKAGVASVVWKGRLASVVPGMTYHTLKFESIFTSMRRPGLRARYQKSCRHALYGRGCTLNAEDFADDCTATAISGTTLTVTEAAAKVDGYYVGGMFRSPDGVLSYIIAHVGTAITLQRLSYSITQAVTVGFPFSVKLYPGCPHDRVTCDTRFNNKLNYGGFDFIPSKNPMGGSSIV